MWGEEGHVSLLSERFVQPCLAENAGQGCSCFYGFRLTGFDIFRQFVWSRTRAGKESGFNGITLRNNIFAL